MKLSFSAAATVVTGLLGMWAVPVAAKPRAPRPVMLKVPVPDAANASIAQFRYRIKGVGVASAQPRVRIKLKVLNGRRLPTGVIVAGAAGTATVKGHRDIVVTVEVGRTKTARGRSARAAASMVEIQVTAVPHLRVAADGSVVKRNVVRRRARRAGMDLRWEMPTDAFGPGYLYRGPRGTPAAIFLKGIYDLYVGRPSPEAQAVLLLLEAIDTYVLTGKLACHPFDPFEIECVGSWTGRYGSGYGPAPARAADTRHPLDAIKVVMPDRAVTNSLCPSQLPHATVSTTVVTNDTLTCDGGTLPLDQNFKVNIRTSPPPASGMGGKLFGRQDGVLRGPFAVTGP